MTRLWTSGSPIRVELDEKEQPASFGWNGGWHPVEMVLNTWRVDVGWWKFRVWREHYKLTTTTGLMVIIFHDLSGDGWYLQRLYD